MPEKFDLRKRKKHSLKSRVSPYTSFVLKSLTTCSITERTEHIQGFFILLK